MTKKTPDKGPKKNTKNTNQKINFKRTKDKPHENNVDSDSGVLFWLKKS